MIEVALLEFVGEIRLLLPAVDERLTSASSSTLFLIGLTIFFKTVVYNYTVTLFISFFTHSEEEKCTHTIFLCRLYS